MISAYVTTGKILENQIIQLDEPLNLTSTKIRVTIEPIEEVKTMDKRIFGYAKDWLTVKPEFYEPLEDFKEYME